jgi:antitoxin component HigA of HigAB toxin-antitoxin module
MALCEHLLLIYRKKSEKLIYHEGYISFSEILNGKRELNVRQVHALAEKFKVSSAVFV